MHEIECETCIKRKTKYCPNSSECYETIDKPYYQNRIMLLEEIQQLKGSLQTYEILLKANVEENQQLKEQLQQKEFIKYLKSMLSSEKDNFSVARVKDILEKYKEIIEILDNKGEIK